MTSITFLSLQARAEDTGRLATLQELRQFHDEGHYRVCLQQIGRVLRSDDAIKGYDRFDLLLLQGDCLLHLNDPASAQLAYSKAGASPDAKQALQGRAMALLIRRSTRMMYRPRDEHNSSDRINIAQDEDRITALRALLKDEFRVNRSKFDKAEKADDLVPIQEVLPTLADLYAVECTATGGDRAMRPILESIGQRARTLIARELDLRAQTVAALDKRAHSLVGGWWQSGLSRRGLSTYDRRELRDLIDCLQRVEETARLGRELAGSFDGDIKTWEPLIANAQKLVRRAQDVLDGE